MTQFIPELAAKVVAQTKTETRRPVKEDDRIEYFSEFNPAGEWMTIEPKRILAIYRNNRLLWQVGKTYAVQPGRGEPAIARYKLLELQREDVRDISPESVIAEGFLSKAEFWRVWCGFYDDTKEIEREFFKVRHLETTLRERPNNLYDGWVKRFELVEVY